MLSGTPARNAAFQGRIRNCLLSKMATVIVTMKIMPSSPDENLDSIKEQASKLIAWFGGTVGKVEFEPVAFGIKAVVFMFALNESLGGTEDVEAKIASITGVNSVQVTDVRRAVG